MGGVSVENASVIKTGLVKTAAAPWKLLPVWQTTSSCVMAEGRVGVEHVYVIHNIQARPVRTAFVVRAHVRTTWSVWSVCRLGQDRRRTGEYQLLLIQGVGIQSNETLQPR